MKQLRWVDLSDTALAGVETLAARAPNLTNLYIYRTPVSDVSPLTALPALRDLGLTGTPAAKSTVRETLEARGVKIR